MKLFISFSGGRTSAFMTKYLLDNHKKDYEEIIVIFANTGQEHPKTLEFIRQCDDHFGFNTVWIEAVVHNKKGKGNTAKVVTYDTASRNGEPYEKAIAKHGIPNMAFPHCTRETKTTPMKNYLRSIGWKNKDYVVAIGIRADEQRRVDKKACKNHIIYPLIDMIPVDKDDILDWWKQQPFDLEIPEHLGNCTWCWKKSLNKHMHVIHDMPEAFDFPELMESKYPFVGPDNPTKARRFFRGQMSVQDLKKAYWELDGKLPKIKNDTNSCSQSCELFPTISL